MSKNIVKKISKKNVNNNCGTLKNEMECELINIVMTQFKKQIKDDTIYRAAVLGPNDNSFNIWTLCLLGKKRPYKVTVYANEEIALFEYIEH